MPATRTIRGAVLNVMGAEQPYAASRPITVDELELEGPGPGELLVRIEAAGLCHSDLSVVNGSRPRPLPMLLGHEAAGIVEEVGHGVGTVRPGQRVVMTFLPRCGECAACATQGRLPCERGSASNDAGTLLTGARRLKRGGEPVHHHLGVSGFATHAVVDERSVVPVGDDVPPTVAALLGCAVLTGGGALLNAARITPESSVAVVGLGGVGMAGLLTALARGAGSPPSTRRRPSSRPRSSGAPRRRSRPRRRSGGRSRPTSCSRRWGIRARSRRPTGCSAWAGRS